MNGWIVLDKPTNCNSRKAGAILAKIFGAKTFGHIGTLDPMASGLLPIALGEATKMIPFWQANAPKEYFFDVIFGFETDTLDITGDVTQKNDKIPTEQAVRDAVSQIKGEIMQVPPRYSAIHINGVRAHKMARKGIDFDVPPRPVTIFELEYLGKTDNAHHFRTLCSVGTYVRSIGRDIANICETVGTVSMIYRTQTNGLNIKNAVKLDFLENLYNNGKDCKEYLQSTDYGLGDIPVCNLNGIDADFYKSGRFIKVSQDYPIGLIRVYCDEQFTGIGSFDGELLRPKRTLI